MTASPTVAPSPLPARFPKRRADRSYLRTPAVLLALPCTVLALLFLSANPPAADYALAHAAAVTGTMSIVAPVLALAAVWEALTLRELWGLLTVRRAWWRVLLGRLAPVLGVGVLVQLTIYVATFAQLSKPAWPGWQMPFLSLLSVAAWTFLGAAVALVLGRLLALTVGLLVPYLALTLPAGWEPLWLRHVNGSPFDCCSTSEVLDPRVTIGSAGMLGMILVISLCVARVRLAPAQHRPLVAGVVAVGALIGGVVCAQAAAGLGASPARERSPEALVCRTEVCLWPEDTAAFGANAAAWEAVRASWSRLGLPAPVTNRIGPIEAGGMLAITTTAASENAARTTMAQLLPRALAGCTGNFDDPARDERFDRLSLLLLRDLKVADPSAPVVTVPDPQPVPADAAQLWRQIGSCVG